MENIDAYEAKNHLPKLLARVMKGEQIIITKHGVPVAILSPPDFRNIVNTKSFIAELQNFREKQSLKGISIQDMIEKGRK